MIDIDIELRQGDFDLACRLCSEERVVGLFGPSGAGKSSLLRAVAGLNRPDRGRIRIGEHCVFDAARGVNVPAHARRIGFVFQQSLLFPHLNVWHNLIYGRWFSRRKLPRSHIEHVIDLLDLAPLLKRRPSGLSGGESQRVAIGRALLSAPDLLLLDEPLASLDAHRKDEVLPYIERLSAGGDLPIIYVSHQLDELIRLARQHVVAISGGRIVFSGPTADFLSRPELLGGKAGRDAGVLLRARISCHETRDNLSVLVCPNQKLYVPRIAGLATGAWVTVHIRARDVILARRRPVETSALNQLAGVVTDVRSDSDADGVVVSLDIDGQRLDARITHRSARQLGIERGESIYAVIKSLALAEQAWERLRGL